jgi:hypothetical protein
MSFAGSHGINYKVASTSQGFGLLDMSLHRDGLFVFGQANGALTIYDWVKVDNDGQVVQLTTTVSGAEPTQVGAVQVAFADNDFGWAFAGIGGGSGKGIKGTFLASYVADAKAYTTATAGAADDTATDCIQHVCGITTVGGSTASAEIFASGVMCTNGQD